MIEELKSIIETSKHGNWKSKIEKNPLMMQFIMDSTKFLDDRFTLLTRVYYVLNGLTDIVRCEVCGKPMYKNAPNLTAGIYPNCSRKCASINKKTRDKVKKTCNDRFGCDNVFQNENIKAKSRSTMLDRYGVEYTHQSKQLTDKCRKTCLEHYGVDHQWKNKDVQAKNRSTILQKYGNDSPLNVQSFKDKFKITRKINRYNSLLENKFVIPNFSLDEFLKVEFPEDTMLSWKCIENTHNHVFESVLDENNLVRHGSPARCLICHPITNCFSQEETEVVEYIKSIYDGKVLNRTSENRQLIAPQEIDILIPSKKIGIEFDGLYYHCDDSNKDKNYHLHKTERMEKLGWKLIHIFEDEWVNKREICKSRLCSALGCNLRKIFARKCSIEEISYNETEEFLNRTHIQGSVKSKINIALKYEGRIVSVMTFGKPRFEKGYDFELLRFSNELFTQVIGGAGKMLKYFERNYRPKSIISYADRRWSKGDLYNALGFSFKGYSRPSYWYVKGVFNRENRVKYQKHKLSHILKNFDKNLSEMENMRNNGFRVIWDCGNMVFEKHLT